MDLAQQWRQIQAQLPENWAEARLDLTIADPRQARRVAALLGPLTPGSAGAVMRVFSARGGAGPSPEQVRRCLERLDAERIEGRLELVSASAAAPQPPASRPTVAAGWDEALAALPADWSDLYAAVELASSDDLDRGALLMAPANPFRFDERPAFRFRCARRFGYGVSPGMARRCLSRLDEESIRGRVQVLHALCDSKPVATQGPVWYLGGRVV